MTLWNRDPLSFQDNSITESVHFIESSQTKNTIKSNITKSFKPQILIRVSLVTRKNKIQSNLANIKDFPLTNRIGSPKLLLKSSPQSGWTAARNRIKINTNDLLASCKFTNLTLLLLQIYLLVLLQLRIYGTTCLGSLVCIGFVLLLCNKSFCMITRCSHGLWVWD